MREPLRAGFLGRGTVLALALVLAGCPEGPISSDGGDDPGSPDGSTELDAGWPDAGTSDAGSPDAGSPDAGRPDAGRPDAGAPDAGPEPVNEVDVLVVGASAGGIAAALQASRMGRTVALLEETDHVGGQLLSVTAMDETHGADGPVEREGGIYGEFAARIIAHYAPRPVGTCLFNTATLCFEPRDGQDELRAMLAQRQAPGLPKFILATRTRVASVQRSPDGGRVVGATTDDGGIWRSQVLIDATEYGDVMPLAQVPYRVGNGAWDPENGASPPMDGCVQEITYPLIIRFYDGGIPAGLDLRGADAGDDYPKFSSYWTGIVRDEPDGGPVCTTALWSWTCHARYRGTPDRDNPVPYTSSGRPTKTTINALNDYPTVWSIGDAGYPVRAVEDRAFRKLEECRARKLTLQFLYYGQTSLGADWAASDEVSARGVAEPCDEALIPPAFRGNDRLFTQVPYVRESRRLIGVRTLTGPDILRVTTPGVNSSFGQVAARRFPTSVAVGYYTNDLHGCYGQQTMEAGLEDAGEHGGNGPFQIPFGSFVPRSIDGFLVAEKNLSQSRLANGATRLHPTCMATGQAAGALAALSALRGEPARSVPPVLVQRALLAAGSALSVYRFQDLPHNHPRWADAQLVSTHGILAGVGGFSFGAANPLTREQAAVVLQRTLRYPLAPSKNPPTFSDVPDTSGTHRFVESMAAEGLTAGCGGGLFCPGAAVTRAQLAVFLAAGLKLTTVACPASSPPYPDVTSGHYACPAIKALEAIGVSVGCGGGNFCPDVAVNRGDAAAFAASALGYMAANPTAVGACYRTPPDYCPP